ncbi:hypothetical protein DSCW_01160 [Desulfosarcina widdelii]|uniref:Uncharacterized protein n=1 Tax=Desulfosarcina widdelii TaxID=947919 RepID=A0A5K7YXD9_9BACT|nr:hypothetical protein [Desulfosarcina widdelii]BBO72699.1 hypothetical protein DSCW_01160 [Desulfosarcina widdelii]
MIEEARITFYEIERCGYYRYNHDEPEFGSVLDVMSQLHDWVKQDDCVLGETCTYKVEEGESVYHTYCFDLVKGNPTNDFLLTTWNEVPSVNGQIAAVNATEHVGAATVNLSEIAEGHIPGYATYFWIIPERKIFATICFHNALNGHQNFKKYMKEYIAKFTSYVVAEEDEDQTNIIGYAQNPGEQAQNYLPSFNSRLFRLPSKLEYLRNNHQFIKKIIRKNKLNPDVQENLSFWEWMLRNIGIADPEPLENEIRIRYEFNRTPSIEELNTIIHQYYEDHDSKWDDVGFHLEGEDAPIWLSHSVAKNKFDLDIEKDNAEIINANSLLAAICQNRQNILNLVNN